MSKPNLSRHHDSSVTIQVIEAAGQIASRKEAEEIIGQFQTRDKNVISEKLEISHRSHTT
jgi:hypothetical protein